MDGLDGLSPYRTPYRKVHICSLAGTVTVTVIRHRTTVRYGHGGQPSRRRYLLAHLLVLFSVLIAQRSALSPQ